MTNIGGETDPAERAEKLNAFFSTIAKKLVADFPSGTPARTEKVHNQPKFKLKHVDETQIEKHI